MIFSDLPKRRTVSARVRAWRASSGRGDRDAMTRGIEHHERMVRALHAALGEANDTPIDGRK